MPRATGVFDPGSLRQSEGLGYEQGDYRRVGADAAAIFGGLKPVVAGRWASGAGVLCGAAERGICAVRSGFRWRLGTAKDRCHAKIAVLSANSDATWIVSAGQGAGEVHLGCVSLGADRRLGRAVERHQRARRGADGTLGSADAIWSGGRSDRDHRRRRAWWRCFGMGRKRGLRTHRAGSDRAEWWRGSDRRYRDRRCDGDLSSRHL